MTRQRRAPARGAAGASLADVGEDRLIAELVRGLGASPLVEVGAGDDCAVLRLGASRWLWTTDAQIEGTHFQRAWLSAVQLGRRAYAVNASDIAAMGGTPRLCSVSIAAPASLPRRDLLAIEKGIVAAAARDGATVVGGNLARASEVSISIGLLGEAPRRPLLRSGARPGHAIYVTGTLGGAALGLAHVERDPRSRSAAARRFREPSPRLATGRALASARAASAAMDLSDGLMADLDRMCAASDVGARIELGSLPMSADVRKRDPTLALQGGEDYELLCAVSPRQERTLSSLQRELDCPITRIGEFTEPASGIVLADVHGRECAIGRLGFEHFAQRRRPRR